MLVNGIQIVNVNGSNTFSLNVDSGTSPLNDFDVTVEDRSDAKRYKQQQDGVWPTRSYRAGMVIHMEGSLFADTSVNYVALRKSLVLALYGTPGSSVVNDHRGTIYFEPAGEVERWYARFGGATFSAPVKGNYPSMTDILISLETFDPWFIGESSNNKYYWS